MTVVLLLLKRYGPSTAKTDKHGVVNDMTKNQLNDLVDYLKSLRAPEYENKSDRVHQASVK